MSKIIVVGDALLDVDTDGSTTRLVPDEPAPVVDIRHRWFRPGGAGLAAALLATRSRIGSDVDVTLIAAFGDDDSGRRLIDLLAPDLAVRRLRLDGTTPTKSRIRVSGRTIARLDDGDGRAAHRPVPVDIRQAIRSADAVLVSDYGRGVAADPGIRSLLADRANRIPVIWDPHPRGPAPIPGCWMITPNRDEAYGYASRFDGDFHGDHDRIGAGHDDHARVADRCPAAIADDLRRRWDARAVAVTMAEQGALLQTGRAAAIRIPVPPDSTPTDSSADTCGAGDRFAGAVTAELADGADPVDAVRNAVLDASRFVGTGGATAVNTEESTITAAPHPSDLAGCDLAEQVRRRGGKVVATGGCFDLLHPGHLALLRRARELGDALVVCLNSDASVRRLKGPGRPVNTAADRVTMLLELGPVDSVIVFDEADPTALLSRLRPDIWVKGDDYADRPIPETAAVRRYGGDVVFLPTVDGYSTTRILQEVTARCSF